MEENKELMEEMPDLVTLSDDEGNEFTLEVLDELDLDGNHYIAMLPVYDDPKDMLNDEDPLVIMKQVSEPDGDFFEEIEDEEEFARVGDMFANRLSEVFDIE
jgi:uncharacterized protein YrzB (UPF0473 family)